MGKKLANVRIYNRSDTRDVTIGVEKQTGHPRIWETMQVDIMMSIR